MASAWHCWPSERLHRGGLIGMNMRRTLPVVALCALLVGGWAFSQRELAYALPGEEEQVAPVAEGTGGATSSDETPTEASDTTPEKPQVETSATESASADSAASAKSDPSGAPAEPAQPQADPTQDPDPAAPLASGPVGSGGWQWVLKPSAAGDTCELTFEYTGSASSKPNLDIPDNFIAGISDALGEHKDKISAITFPADTNADTGEKTTYVSKIGNNAFAGLTGVKTANLEDTKIQDVGEGAFQGCTALEKVTMPATARRIMANSFNGCTALATVDFSQMQQTNSVIQKGAFQGSGIKSVTIPDGLTSIQDSAFQDCKQLETVTLPDSLAGVGKQVFEGCTALTSVDMPAFCRMQNERVQDSDRLFANCPALETLTLRNNGKNASTGNNRNTLPNELLAGDTALKKLDLSGYDSLGGTFNLRSQNTGKRLFANNDLSNLEEIVLPKNTNITIDGNTFSNKSGLTSLDVFKNPQGVNTLDAGAFKNTGLTTADLSDWTGLTRINNEVLSSNHSLESVTIPKNVTTLGARAMADDPALTSVRIDSTKLTSCDANVFDGSGAGMEITIGKGVEQLTGNFLVATPTNSKVKFEGESIIKITKPTKSGGRHPLKALDGTYWVTAEGVLYKLENDGTASLAYVPDDLPSYTVPASITTTTDAGVPGATYTVDRMEPHAVHLAPSLTSLTFEQPSQVTIAPQAFTGRSTSDDANGLQVNGKDHIDPNDFDSVSILCNYPLDEDYDTSKMRLVPYIENEVENASGTLLSKTIVTINDKDPGDDGVYHYATGQQAKYTIAISNEDNGPMDDVVRIYFDYDAPGQNMGGFPPGEYSLKDAQGNSYPVNVVETETPGIYYYELTGIINGSTLTFQNDVHYPSPETPGGTLRIWTETISKEEAELKERKVVDPTDYIQLDWSTSPVVYSIDKANSSVYRDSATRTPSIRVNNAGEAYVSDLAYTITEKNVSGSHSTSEGLDFIRWVAYEDIIDLPPELAWRPEVFAALAKGGAASNGTGDGWWVENVYTSVSQRHYNTTTRAIRLRLNGTVYDLAYLYNQSNNTYSDILGLTPRVVNVGGTNKLKLSWYVNNSTTDSTGSATSEYPTHVFYLRVGDSVVEANVDKVNELFRTSDDPNPLKVHNSVSETRHYSYSPNQTSEDDAYNPVKADAGMEVGKVWQNNNTDYRDVYGGNYDPARYTISNTGIMTISQWGDRLPEPDEHGRTLTNGVIMQDTVPYTHYLTAADIEKMLAAKTTAGEGSNSQQVSYGDWLTVTINKATLTTIGQNQYVDGTEQSNKYTLGSNSNISAANDNGARAYQKATITITKNDEGQVVATLSGDPIAENNGAHVIGAGGEYGSLQEFFDAVGYFPTRETTYTLTYTTDDFALRAGQKLSFDIRSSTKTTPMMLTVDSQYGASSYDSSARVRNTATTKAMVGGTWQNKSATTFYRDWNREMFLSKTGYANGTSITSSSAQLNEGTVIDYRITGSTSNNNFSYDHQIMSDYMEGALALLAPVNQNSGLTAPDGSALDTFSAGGVTYYLLNKPGDYHNVVIGSASTNGTQTYQAEVLTVGERTDASGRRTALTSFVQWKPFENWGVSGKGSGNNTQINYKAVLGADAAGMIKADTADENKSYVVNNKAWLGDHQGHRLWNVVAGEYQVYSTNKYIVNPNGGKADGTDTVKDGTLIDYARIHPGETITYQMEVTNRTPVATKVTGDRLRDALPDTRGIFAWTRGDAEAGVAANVTNLRYVASNENIVIKAGDQVFHNDGTPNTDDTYWRIEKSTKAQNVHVDGSLTSASRTGGYDILWDKSFEIDFPSQGTVKIYVDVTFPERADADTPGWDQYVAALKGGTIFNTFYLDGLWDDVSHTLEAEGRPVLYKGVYDTGITTHGTSTDTSTGTYKSNKSRMMYSNGVVPTGYSDADLKASTVTYYTVVYNGSYDRMYLSDLQDQLPRGFTFNSMCNTADTASNLNYSWQYETARVGYSGASSRTYVYTEYPSNEANRLVTMDNSADAIDNNTITYVSARVSATTANGSDGRQHITFSISDGASSSYHAKLHYDPDVKKYYLKPGEALRFGYNCLVDVYEKTDDEATNTVAMPYYDYYGTDFTLHVPDENGEGGAVQKVRANGNVTNNDGDCETMTDAEVAENFAMNTDAYQQEPYKNHDEGNWLVSDVTLERAEVVPGVQKVIGGLTSYSNGTSPTRIEGSNGTSSLYGSAYTGGAKSNDVVNWRLRVYDDSGSGNEDVVNTVVNYTVVDTVNEPYLFTGRVFYNMYQANSAAGTRVTPQSQYLFTLGPRSESDTIGTEVLISAGNSGLNTNGPKIRIGSAEDDADDSWYTFNTGKKEGRVKIERDAKGQEVLTIKLVGSDYSIPSGYWMDICAHTMYSNLNDKVISDVKYNDLLLYPEQGYDAARVAQGRARTKEVVGEDGETRLVNDGIQSGASIVLTMGYTTTSHKRVTELEDGTSARTSNTARSDGSPTFITLGERCKKFRYDLYMVGPSATMSKIVFIDSLPQPGDHSSFVEEDKRNSEFKVSFWEKNLDFTVTLAKRQGASETTLDKRYYTVELSTQTEFDSRKKDSDWDGVDNPDVWKPLAECSEQEIAAARSFRVIIKDPNAWDRSKRSQWFMTDECQLHLAFNGKIDDPNAAPGQIAWNSFGYRYQVPQTLNGTEEASLGISLDAQPLNVGIKFPAAPQLEKRLNIFDQKMEPKTEEVEVPTTEPVLDDEGNPVLDEDGEPVLREVTEPVLDEEGNPTYDEDGNPVTRVVTHTETRTVTKQVERPVLDADGNPMLDEDGNPVTERVEEPVMVPVFQPVLDDEGNPLLDENGEPVMEPAMAEGAHKAERDLHFGFIVYEGEKLPELDDALNMDLADIADVVEGNNRAYIYVPLTIAKGESAAKGKLWTYNYQYRYNDETGTFEEYDKTDASGNLKDPNWHWEKKGTYSVVELPMGDYLYQLKSIKAGGATHESNNVSFESTNTQVVSVVATNRWEPQYVDITGRKVWDDANNQDGMRPESITVRLLQDGLEIDQRTVTAEDGWQWSFEHLLKQTETGHVLTYQVTEDAVDNYSTTMAKEPDNALADVITNVHTPGKTSVTVTKTWDDGDNADGSRPESVKVHLLADGVDTGKTLVLSAKNHWTGTFTNLDQKANGTDIAYSVSEEAVEGYESRIEGDAAEGYTITNTHEPVPPEKPGRVKRTVRRVRRLLRRLPRTGDLSVPVLPLAAAGTLVLVLGVLYKRRSTKR